MPLTHSRSRVAAAALVGSLLLALSFSAAAEAARTKAVPAELRVVDGSGRVLAERTQYTGGAVSIKTDPQATCFGPGDGGSGDRVEVPGPTALSLLADAAATDRDVRPLSITDAFSFGLGLCGIGKAIAPSIGFWSLKQDHAATMTGGDSTTVEAGDSLLWYLVNDYNEPPPVELVLRAKRERDGEIPVRAFAYGDDGKKTPAIGAGVTGADDVTGADGRTVVAADARVVDIVATLDGAIPSNEESICTVKASKCPAGYAGVVAGTSGNDKINVGREPVTVKCGAGRDVVKLSARGRAKLKGCEKVRAAK